MAKSFESENSGSNSSFVTARMTLGNHSASLPLSDIAMYKNYRICFTSLVPGKEPLKPLKSFLSARGDGSSFSHSQ